MGSSPRSSISPLNPGEPAAPTPGEDGGDDGEPAAPPPAPAPAPPPAPEVSSPNPKKPKVAPPKAAPPGPASALLDKDGFVSIDAVRPAP
jgi:hypothetical protein